MELDFRIIQHYPELNEYVERIFVFQRAGRLPSDDLKLIVPNACLKLVFPFRNGLIGKTDEWQHRSRQDKATLIGISDIPAMVDIETDAPAGNITVEFSPLGAYRFFNFRMDEIKNRILDYSDVAEKMVADLEERLVNAPAVKDKLHIIQQYLLHKLVVNTPDPVFEYCVAQITASRGRMSIRELEKITGYSARWLNMKFQERLGLSPKNLASLIRFQQYYKALVSDREMFFLEKEFYNYYYDQSHFIKDFKRFTGHSPFLFGLKDNDYDRIFYKG